MNKKKISPLHERLQEIINISYRILCNKIAAGSIEIDNEASMQMQFGIILSQVGRLHEFAQGDYFSVQLETTQNIECTKKSKHGKARCDITVEFSNGADKAEAMIELKYFKRNGANETITGNRYSVLCDVENLEKYRGTKADMLCYEIVYTNNTNYANPNKQKFSLSDGATICSYAGDATHAAIELNGSYPVKWDIYEPEHCFLKVEL